MNEILAITADPKDNVATVFSNDVKPGVVVNVHDKAGTIDPIPVHEEIPFGHKLALCPIPAGEKIVKYGEVIGVSDTDIQRGDYVHVHNMKALRGRGDL